MSSNKVELNYEVACDNCGEVHLVNRARWACEQDCECPACGCPHASVTLRQYKADREYVVTVHSNLTNQLNAFKEKVAKLMSEGSK